MSLNLSINNRLTVLNLLQDLRLNGDGDLIISVLLLLVLLSPSLGIDNRATGDDKERISLRSEVEVFLKRIWFESQEWVVFSHLQQVVVSLVHEWNLRFRIWFRLVWLSKCEKNVFSPSIDALNNIDREQSQGVKVLDELVEMHVHDDSLLVVLLQLQLTCFQLWDVGSVLGQLLLLGFLPLHHLLLKLCNIFEASFSSNNAMHTLLNRTLSLLVRLYLLGKHCCLHLLLQWLALLF